MAKSSREVSDLPPPVNLKDGFGSSSLVAQDGKESTCNAGDLGSILGLGGSPGGRAWQPTPVFLPGESPWTEEPGGLGVHGVTKSQMQLSH